MLSIKIRTIIISSVATAALSVPGVASAALLLRSPGTVTPTPVVHPTTVTAKEAGSAGVPGYDDKHCENLASNVKELEAERSSQKWNNEIYTARGYRTEQALEKTRTELTDNCLVVD